jgi:hypothetical protein
MNKVIIIVTKQRYEEFFIYPRLVVRSVTN